MSLEHASTFGFGTYSSLRNAVIKKFGTGSNLEVHHLIEKRFAKLFGQKESEMLSIVMTKAEHEAFTKLWQSKIGLNGWKTTQYTTSTVPSKSYVENIAKEIYSNYPEILKQLGL